MLEAGTIHDLASLPGVMQWYWCKRKMDPFDSALIFDVSTCMDKERFVPSPQDTRGTGEHGRSCTLLHHGFQEWILARSAWPQELQQYTAFTVGNLGFYEFTRMPFGLCNVPTMFQRLMQNTLGELNLTYWVIYLDDVIIFGHTEEEQLKCLLSSI